HRVELCRGCVKPIFGAKNQLACRKRTNAAQKSGSQTAISIENESYFWRSVKSRLRIAGRQGKLRGVLSQATVSRLRGITVSIFGIGTNKQQSPAHAGVPI